MKKTVLHLLCTLAATGCLLLSACASSTDQAATEEPPITIALTQDILSFDPMQTSDIFSEAVLRCVYTTLYDFDDDLNLRPKLAESAEQTDDNTWRFQIHDNVKFQDGSDLTTDDVIFSIERATLGGRTQKLLEMIDSLEKVDDTTFLIHTKDPYSDLPSLFAKAETSIVSKTIVEDPDYDFAVPVGAGPFQLVSREESNRISLERFDDYFLTKAASKYLDFVIIVTEQERTTALQNGDVDILFSVSAYDCNKLKFSPNVKLLSSSSTKIEYLSLNNLHPPLDDPNVRLAISYAINRDIIAREVYHGYSTPASSVIPNGLIGSTDSVIAYDPEYAKELLREAGMENGFDLTVITIDTIRKNTLEYIKLDLAKLGINLNYNLVTMKEAVAMMNAGEHDGILVGWAFNPDPNSVLPLIFGTGSGKTMNSCNYSNPVIDELLMQGREESAPDKREQIYQEINNILIQEAPIVVLQNPMVLSAAHDSIEGLHFNSQGLIQYESIYRK